MKPLSLASVPDFLALTYRSDLHLLFSRWQRPVTGAELRVGYRATLALAQAVSCPYWQVDLRGRNAPEPSTQQWLTDTFLPGLVARLAAPVYLGYLLTPQLLSQMAPAATAQGHAAEAAGAPVLGHQVAFFAEEGPLTSWLTSCQHRSLAQQPRLALP